MTKPHPIWSEEKPHRLLPADAIARLQKAAETENTPADPMARTKAIEKATQWVRHKYPLYFK